MNFTMPNMSDLRVQSLEVRDSREKLNRELGRMAGETVRFLNAMAAIVSHGGKDVDFSWGVMSFSVHLGEKGKFVVDFDLRAHDEETRRYMEELDLDVRMTSYLYILSHASEIASACTEEVARRSKCLEEGVRHIRSLIGTNGDPKNGRRPGTEVRWGRSRRDERPSAGKR